MVRQSLHSKTEAFVCSIKNPAIADGVKCVCVVELDLEGSVLSCFGDMSTGGCINNDGDGEGWDVDCGPTEHGADSTTIESLELFVVECLMRCLSVHWSWFGCVRDRSICSDADTIAELTET